MAFQVSPGVEVKEIDATSVIPAVSTSIGGFAGSFNWGPVAEICTVGSESELADKFGTPDDSTAKYFLTAAAFLKYGNALKVVRVLSGHDNASGDGSGQLIKNKEDYEFLIKFFGRKNIFLTNAKESFALSSNVFVISPEVVVSHTIFKRLNLWLEEKGILVEKVDYSSVSKMSGLFRCSTLPLYRE